MTYFLKNTSKEVKEHQQEEQTNKQTKIKQNQKKKNRTSLANE